MQLQITLVLGLHWTKLEVDIILQPLYVILTSLTT